MKLIQKRCEMLLVALVLACLPVLAQSGKTITVNGHVQDVAGLALPGATIVQVGTGSNAAVANDMGDFTITLPSDASVEVMFFGMKTEIVHCTLSIVNCERSSLNCNLPIGIVAIGKRICYIENILRKRGALLWV